MCIQNQTSIWCFYFILDICLLKESFSIIPVPSWHKCGICTFLPMISPKVCKVLRFESREELWEYPALSFYRWVNQDLERFSDRWEWEMALESTCALSSSTVLHSITPPTVLCGLLAKQARLLLLLADKFSTYGSLSMTGRALPCFYQHSHLGDGPLSCWYI